MKSEKPFKLKSFSHINLSKIQKVFSLLGGEGKKEEERKRVGWF